MGIELVAAAVVAAVGLTGTAATIGTVVVGVAITAGLGAIAQALTPNQTGSGTGAGSSITADNRKAPSQSALPPRRMVFGKVAVSGPIFFWENVNPFLYIGYVVGDGEIDGFENVRFNGSDLSFSSSGMCVSVPYAKYSVGGSITVNTTDQPALYGSFRTGAASQAGDAILTQGVVDIDGKLRLGNILSAQWRQRGVATGVFRAHFGADQATHNKLYAGNMTAVFTVRGLKIFDPRPGTQDFNDPSSWVYSNNPALCIAHWLCRRWKNALQYEDIDWPSFMAAANHCDEPVAMRYSQTEPRYRCDGVLTSDESHFTVATRLLTCCAGALYYRRGKVALEVGGAKTPVLTITDRDIVGGVQMQHDAALDKAVNRVRTTFVAPDRAYEICNGPILDRADYQAIDGRVNERTLELPFTASSGTAQRLARRYMEASRLPRQGSMTIGPIGQLLDAGDVIVVQSQLSYICGTFEIFEIVHREDGIALTIAEYDDAIEDWAPNRDQESFDINPASMS